MVLCLCVGARYTNSKVGMESLSEDLEIRVQCLPHH